MEHGSGHALGAMGALVGGNVRSILLGRSHSSLGLSARLGRALVGFGVLGLLCMVAYFVDLGTGLAVLVGLVERGVVYPFLLGLTCVGRAIVCAPSAEACRHASSEYAASSYRAAREKRR